MLLFMCKKLADILINENRSTVLFLSRDGCLIYKLFSFLYPQFKSVYLYSSRIINNNYNDDYILYLKNIYNENECILFDLHGSFNSGRNLFTKVFGHLPRIFIFDISIIKNYYDNITYVGNFVNNTIELFNQDVIGSLIDFKNQKSIHMPCETPLKYIQIMHNTVEDFIKNISDKKIILNKNIFDDDLFWKNYYTDTVIKCEIILHNQLSHNEQTLTYLSNKYFSDKGDNYKCSHHYTIKYQEIISEILHNLSIYNNINNIDLLEIGLNRDNTENIPSLMIWNDYFYKNINITGFDIYSEFSKFNLLYDNINIFIGDQSNEDDLLQLKYKKYDMIIDDGYHGSKHQQISFKTLWSSLKSNGYYIIEDLHYQPELETCIKTKTLFENWKNGNYHSSEYINDVEIERIKNEIESIDFYDSKSKRWGDAVKNAFVYIKKK